MHWSTWLLLIWWAGMAPAAFIAGRMYRDADKPPSSYAVLLFIFTWPLQLIAAPIVLVFLIARRKPKKGAKGGQAKQ